MAGKKYWYVMYYITYQYLCPTTPSNAPRNDVALLKTIMYRAIKTTCQEINSLTHSHLVVLILFL